METSMKAISKMTRLQSRQLINEPRCWQPKFPKLKLEYHLVRHWLLYMKAYMKTFFFIYPTFIAGTTLNLNAIKSIKDLERLDFYLKLDLTSILDDFSSEEMKNFEQIQVFYADHISDFNALF